MNFRQWIRAEQRRSGHTKTHIFLELTKIIARDPKDPGAGHVSEKMMHALYYGNLKFTNKETAEKYSAAIKSYCTRPKSKFSYHCPRGTTQAGNYPEESPVPASALLRPPKPKRVSKVQKIQAKPYSYGLNAKAAIIEQRLAIRLDRPYMVSLDRGKSYTPYWIFEHHGLLNRLQKLVTDLESYTAEELLEITAVAPTPDLIGKGLYYFQNHKLHTLDQRIGRLRRALTKALTNNSEGP